MKELIHIYYTNDLHSNFSAWPQVATYIKGERSKKSFENKTSLLVDVGDHVDRVNLIAEAFMGQANVSLMNDLNYDFATIGNNEGITMSQDDLYKLYELANFPIICSNLKSKREEPPSWLHQQIQVESVHGVKIGILGLTAPFNAFYNLLGWHVDPPFSSIEQLIDELKQSVDVIVLLSHLGINEDRAIAERFPEIDVIIGGHTHHLLRTGEYVHETLLTAAGKFCMNVGEVILTWDHSNNTLLKKEAYTTEITHLMKDEKTEEKLIHLEEQANVKLGEPIVTIDEQLKVDWFAQTDIMQRLTNTLTEHTGADCGLLNAGLLLEDFPAGDITYNDVHRICPHPINPCIVQLRGDELREVIRASLTDEFMHLQLKGFGFRGEVLGRMNFSKMQVNTKRLADGNVYVDSVYVKGEKLRSDQVYKVATADTFTFGRLLPEIAKSEHKQYFLPEMIRDLLVTTLKTYE